MKNNGEAVSPVVGVMLMLVVTIIIAAVVSGFAGGMTSDVQVAPNIMLDVQIDAGEEVMTIEHLSGDRVHTKDLQIITYHTLENGTVVKMTNDKNSDSFTSSYGSETVLPFLNDMIKTGGMAYPAAHFGNYTLSAGDIMDVEYTNAQGVTALEYFLGYKPSSGDIIDVKILHVPSEKYIYDKEVIVV